MRDESSSDLDLYDEGSIQGFVRFLFPLLRLYFRADIRITKPLSPQSIIVANHSGGMTPVDWLIYVAMHNHLAPSKMYVLVHPMFMFVPTIRRALARRGIVKATARNFYDAIDRGASVLVFPGGDFDSFRPFHARAQVNLGGRYGFARVALKRRVPITPVVSAGSHHTIFVVAQGLDIAKALRLSRLGLQTFPLVLCFPWLVTIGPMSLLPTIPFPARVLIQTGDPLNPPSTENDIRQASKQFYRHTSQVMNSLLKKAYSDRGGKVRKTQSTV